jgi:hypothetical protein
MRALPLTVLLAAITGCAPSALPVRAAGYCAPPAPIAWSIAEDASPPPSADRTERLAALLGLRDVLLERRASRAPASVESRVRALERLGMARVVVAATSAELDCEGERAEQAADYLTRRGSTGVQELTVASVLVAAGTSIAGVLLSTKSAKADVQDAVAISGGALTVGLGLGSLYVHPRVNFTHPRNLLADVWSGPAASTTYAPPVWAYLTRAEFSNDQRDAIRARIVARWRKFQQIENDPSATALLFGAGGSYDADALRARAAMLDEVKAEVDLANQDLAALDAALVQ